MVRLYVNVRNPPLEPPQSVQVSSLYATFDTASYPSSPPCLRFWYVLFTFTPLTPTRKICFPEPGVEGVFCVLIATPIYAPPLSSSHICMVKTKACPHPGFGGDIEIDSTFGPAAYIAAPNKEIIAVNIKTFFTAALSKTFLLCRCFRNKPYGCRRELHRLIPAHVPS